MIKEELKYGNVVETRNGERYIYFGYFKDDLLNIKGSGQVSLSYYKEDLYRKNDSRIDRDSDIMKVYKDYTLQELLWERPKERPDLTNEEIMVLKILARKFSYITKDDEGNVVCFINKPTSKTQYSWYNSNECGEELDIFNHLFDFITFDDIEPVSINWLLKDDDELLEDIQ